MHKVFDVLIGHDPRFELPTAPAELMDFRFKILFEGTPREIVAKLNGELTLVLLDISAGKSRADAFRNP